jgi:hypothetical protein
MYFKALRQSIRIKIYIIDMGTGVKKLFFDHARNQILYYEKRPC